ncbi:MAG TPA: dienelactone hydrolase family protein [Gemmatimonadaceae bacterium]
MTAVMHDRPIDLGVFITTPETDIEADWSVPLHPKGAIVLANGTGNSRFHRHNREVARALYDAGYATLLVDLLTPDEEREDTLTGVFQTDIRLQTERLAAAASWAREEIGDLPLGVLASGIASGAAIVVAVRERGLITAIVSRGGRPDLAAIDLHRLTTPTLLIAGSSDTRIFELNRWALRRMKGEGRIAVVPGASHLFEEPGTLNEMCSLAIRWFDEHMYPIPFTMSRLTFSQPWTP